MNEAFKDSDKLMSEIYLMSKELKQSDIDFYRPSCQKEAIETAEKRIEKSFQLDQRKRKNAEKSDKERVCRQLFLEKFKMFDGRILDQMKMSVSKPLQFFKCV